MLNSIVDIRKREDFESGHIESAINIPFTHFGETIDSIPSNKPVYIICYSGQTAGFTSASLKMAGYNAFSLNRGMLGWLDAELPLVTE